VVWSWLTYYMLWCGAELNITYCKSAGPAFGGSNPPLPTTKPPAYPKGMRAVLLWEKLAKARQRFVHRQLHKASTLLLATTVQSVV